jgi:peroxiredoxin
MRSTQAINSGVLRAAIRLRVGLVIVGLLSAIGIAVAGRSAAGTRPRPVAINASADAPGQHIAQTVHFDLLGKLLADDRRSDLASDWRRELSDPDANCRVESQSHPLVGEPAPDFTLNDSDDRPWNLADHRARGPVVVVFYLGYSCNACVHNLCELNADLPRFESFSGQVVAISGDSAEVTRQRFEQFGAFGFKVLCDPDHSVARQYGVFRSTREASADSEADQFLHGTFIVGPGGEVHWAHLGDAPFRGDQALLFEMARLGDELPSLESAEESLR